MAPAPARSPSTTADFSTNINSKRRGHRRKGGRRSSKSSSSTLSSSKIQTVVRIRPLVLKKERDEHAILEPLPANPAVVVLHPIPVLDDERASSQLVRHNYAPDGVATSHVAEFQMDSVFGTDTSQDKLYFSIGLPITLASIQDLKSMKNKVKPVIMVVTGSRQGGKSYTAFGGGTSLHHKSPSRKQDTDGLVPRMLDSLFSQSQHHQSKLMGPFAVELSIYLVKDTKNKTEKTPGVLVDLLQPAASVTPTKRAAAGLAKGIAYAGSAAKKSSAVKSLVANFETKTGHSIALPKRNNNAKSTYDSVNEPVFLDQDQETSDFRVVNGQTRLCQKITEARETLTTAIKRVEKLRSNDLCHVMVRMNPVLLDSRQKILYRGNSITIVSLSADGVEARTANKREKDLVPGCKPGAYNAVIRCLQTLQQNKDATSQGVEPTKPASIRKIPYQQHSLTMLLQPSLKVDPTVIVVLTSSPGHSYYNETKSLLTDISKIPTRPPTKMVNTGLISSPLDLAEKHAGGVAQVITSTPVVSRSRPNPKHRQKSLSKLPKADLIASDADDERSDREPTCPTATSKEIVTAKFLPDSARAEILSMSYSDSMNDEDDNGYLHDEYLVPIPPPPTARDISTRKLPQYIRSPDASAPQEDDVVPNLRTTPRFAKVPSIMDVLETSMTRGYNRNATEDVMIPEAVAEHEDILDNPSTKGFDKKVQPSGPASRFENDLASDKPQPLTSKVNRDYEERFSALERENDKLRKESGRLLELNKHLERENAKLRGAHRPSSVKEPQVPAVVGMSCNENLSQRCVHSNKTSTTISALSKLSTLVQVKKNQSQDNPWERLKRNAPTVVSTEDTLATRTVSYFDKGIDKSIKGTKGGINNNPQSLNLPIEFNQQFEGHPSAVVPGG